jgi:hypothetical protein
MMGRVRWTQDRGKLPPVDVAATLEDDGTFAVAGPDPGACALLAEVFTAQYRETNPGPADGAPGARFLVDLARRHGGTVKLAEYEPGPPGTTY